MNINFSRISFDDLFNLIILINSSNSKKLSYIKTIYDNKSLFFEDNLNFLICMKICQICDNKVSISEISFNKEEIKQILIEGLLDKKNLIYDFWSFISKFRIESSLFRYFPNRKERLQYSGIRDLLIELDFIYKEKEDVYIINNRYFNRLILTQKQLNELLYSEEEIGKAAELVILQYEIEQLQKFTRISSCINEIRHIAKETTNAGYDIESFDKESANEGIFEKIYIEVKAVNESDFKFYWSYNEISTAKIFMSNYYIYLLPVKENKTFEIGKLKILHDPYSTVYESNEWDKQEEIISLKMKVKENANSKGQNLLR